MKSVRAFTGILTLLLLTATGAAAQQLMGYSIVLVHGDLQPGTKSDLPPAAEGALNNMRDFLPFKSFQLIDSAWILASGGGIVNSQLRGADGQDYVVSIETAAGENGMQRMQFSLQENVAPSRRANERAEVERDLAAMQTLYLQLRDKYNAARSARNANHPDVVRFAAQIADTESRLAVLQERLRDLETQIPAARRYGELMQEYNVAVARYNAALKAVEVEKGTAEARMAQAQVEVMRARIVELERAIHEAGRGPFTRESRPGTLSLIDTQFTMRLGETVVVGTSRVRGDKALIAILTAVPQSKR